MHTNIIREQNSIYLNLNIKIKILEIISINNIKNLNMINNILLNRIWLLRTKNVGIIKLNLIKQYALTGIIMRAGGISFDLRKFYINNNLYNNINFIIPYSFQSDIYDRFLLKLEEILESSFIIKQLITFNGKKSINNNIKIKMETIINKFKLKEDLKLLLSDNIYYSSIEAPKGEMGCIGKIYNTKYLRLKIRSPGFFNLQSYSKVSKNLLLSDSLAILGSYDIVLGEIDR